MKQVASGKMLIVHQIMKQNFSGNVSSAAPQNFSPVRLWIEVSLTCNHLNLSYM